MLFGSRWKTLIGWRSNVTDALSAWSIWDGGWCVAEFQVEFEDELDDLEDDFDDDVEDLEDDFDEDEEGF